MAGADQDDIAQPTSIYIRRSMVCSFWMRLRNAGPGAALVIS